MLGSVSRILELPGLDTETAARRALAGLGYEVRAARAAPRAPERYTYYDTWNTALRRKGYRLRHALEARRWQLLDGAQEISGAEAGDGMGGPSGELGRRIHTLCGTPAGVPYVVATETGVALRLSGASGTSKVKLRVLAFESPFRSRVSRKRVLLILPAVFAEGGGIEALLRQRLGARVTDADLFEMAVDCLDLLLPGTPPPRSLALRSGDTLAEAARKIVARHVLRLHSEAPGVVGDYDPEFVHDMRVAARTLRHALKLFGPNLPPAQAAGAREELAWLAGRLEAVRDQDVFLALLAKGLASLGTDDIAARALLSRVREGRATALAELRAAIGSRRYASLIASLDALSAPLPGSPRRRRTAPEAISRSIRGELARIASRQRRSAASFTPEELHDLRIGFRRIRYTCELLWPLYGKELRRLGARISRYQAPLGDHRDAWASIVATRALAGGPAGTTGATPELLEALAAQEQSALVAARSAFGRLWPRFPELRRKLERFLS